MMRSLFVREEGEALVLASGIPGEWLVPGETLEFGPTPTPHGSIHIRVLPGKDDVVVEWDGRWRAAPPEITVALGGDSLAVPNGRTRAVVPRQAVTPGQESGR